MKTTLLGIGIAVSLLSTTAFAGDRHNHGRGRHQEHRENRQHGWHQGHTGPDRGHHVAPQRHGNNGRYQLRSVQKWVPGGYQQVWVPHQCSGHHHGRRCNGGYYTQQVQAGYYTTVQEWVFVPQVTSYPRFGAAVQVDEYPSVTVSASTPFLGLHFSSPL